MPDEGLATGTIATAEQPTEAVAQQMDEAADAVGEAAEAAAEEGQDVLANRLHALETTLRGELQHHIDSDHAKPVVTEGTVEVVETQVPEPVVKPKKLHWYQRTRGL